MIYAATGEEGIGNGYLPRNASGHQQAGYWFFVECAMKRNNQVTLVLAGH